MKKKLFILGNCLHGGFSGKFKDADIAWDILSQRFNMSFPSEAGRAVMMWTEHAVFEIEQLVMCRKGVTNVETTQTSDFLKRCTKYANWFRF